MKTPDELAAIAVQLVMRVRDVEDAEANGMWLHEQLPDSAEWFRLAFVLAAAVPDDRSWTALTAWAYLRHGIEADPEPVDEGEVLHPNPQSVPHRRQTLRPIEELKPCGTPAAAKRHRRHGEQLCEACRQAERDQAKAINRGNRSAA